MAKLLLEHFSAFEMFKPFIPQAPDSSYIKEMATKSEIVTMPILLKDEEKYSDCVDILDQLENWKEIYSAAGLCLLSAKPNDGTTPCDCSPFQTRSTSLPFSTNNIQK